MILNIKNIKNKIITYFFHCLSHFVSIILPSYEDACYYKLILSILPGLYYREAIPFKIENINPTDIFQPK
jgi:hypothetical protein